MNEALVRKMKAAGCVQPCVSVVSGVDSVLKNLDTKFTSDNVRRLAEWCHKYDLSFTVDLLFGAPGDTLEGAARTLALMEEIKPSVIGMNVGVRLYGNTRFGRAVQNREVETAGRLRGHVEANDDLFLPIFYVSDDRIEQALQDVCDADTKYRLLGYRSFGGVNYTITDAVDGRS